MIDPVRVKSALIAAAGVVAFELAGLPLPFLLGPLTACLVAALAGVTMRDMGWLSKAMRTVLGLAVGSTITPEVIVRLPEMV